LYTIISHFASASGRLRPGPLPGFCPWAPLGDLGPTSPDPLAMPRHDVNPSIVKSWVRRISLLIHRNQGRPKASPATQNASWKSSGDKNGAEMGREIYLFFQGKIIKRI